MSQQIHLEIEDRLKNKRADPTKVFANICYVLMRDLNQPLSEILEMPIPLAMELIKLREKEKKEVEKQFKKAKK